MKYLLTLVVLVFISFKAECQYFSFAHLVLNKTEFSNSELKSLKHLLLNSNSLETENLISYKQSGINPTLNDEINIDIINTIISFSKKGEEKKTLTNIYEIENKLNDSSITKNSKSNFCFLKFVIYSTYNLYIDTTNFQSCYLALDNLQKYAFLFIANYLNTPTTTFAIKNKNYEFIELASKTSNYDFVKALTLIINKNILSWDYLKINKLLSTRDSIIDKIIESNYKNCFNSHIHYSSFLDQKSLINQITLEKIVSLNDLGFISRKVKDFNTSIYYFNQALSMGEKEMIKIIEPELYTNLGLTYTLKKEYEEAEMNYFKSLRIYKNLNNKSKESELYNIIAKNNLLNSKNQLAINNCNQSLSISIPQQDYKNICESYLLLSEIFSKESDFLESNKYFKLYTDYKKAYSEIIFKNESSKINFENTFESINHDVVEEFQKQEQKKLEFLKIKLESNQKERDLIVLKKEAELREATIINNHLEEERAKQALILVEEKLQNKKKEIANLERQNKINSLQSLWIKNNLELSENKNKVLDQNKLINDLKVEEIKKNQKTLIFGLISLLSLLLFLSYFFFKSVKHDKEVQKQNLILSKKNEEISRQRNTILKKNEEMVDSINYALKIQTALLPTDEQFKKAFNNSFVLFKPKDIVSGDFYWIYESGEFIFYATADCTGHGVPGGFMSMLGISLLNDIVKDKKITEPNDVLDLMRVKIISELKQAEKSGNSKDGMDITLCRLNKEKTKLVFATANNDLWLIRNGELIEYESDRQPVGYHFGQIIQFKQQEVDLLKDDIIITFSDGYSDQFGGVKGKKFKYKQLQKILIANSNFSMGEQKNLLQETIENWMGDLEQVDDILLMGVQV